MPKNPVLYIYKGVRVRKWNKVDITIDDSSFREIIDAVERTGFSIKKILALSGKPCERCLGMEVVAFDKKGDPHKIKRGILKAPQQDSGKNIIIHAQSHTTCPENGEVTREQLDGFYRAG